MTVALRFVEVTTVNQNHPCHSTAEIAHMFELAGREDNAIRRLDGCAADLHEIQAAKVAWRRCASTELRAAPAIRHAHAGAPTP
jgi:hypothetical protein